MSYDVADIMFSVLLCDLVVVQLLSHVTLFSSTNSSTPGYTVSKSLLKLMTIESMMPSNHLNICVPLLFLPSIFPNIKVFSSELALCIR